MGQNGMSSDVHQSLIDNLLYCPELKNNLHLLMMIRRKWHTWHCYTDMSWSYEGINMVYIIYHIILYMKELDINTLFSFGVTVLFHWSLVWVSIRGHLNLLFLAVFAQSQFHLLFRYLYNDLFFWSFPVSESLSNCMTYTV